jgi:hypothetical protein
MNIDINKAVETAQAVQDAVASDVPQVLNESELGRSSSSKKVSSTSQKRSGKHSNQNGIAQLRSRLEKSQNDLSQERAKTQTRLANTPSIKTKEDSIDLEYTVTVGKQRYTSSLPVVKGDVAKALLPAIEPFVRVANAALQAHDLRELKQAHTRDNDGKITKDVLRHDGKAAYVANPIDDLRYKWEVIAASPGAMKALQTFAKEVEKLDFSKTPGVTTAEQHRSSYASGIALARALSEYKYDAPVKGDDSDSPDF